MSVDPGAQEIVINEDVDNVLHSGALRDRLQNESLGEGTITLIIRDPNITIIGDWNLDWDSDDDDDDNRGPLHGCKSLLRVDLKGCPKLTQLGNDVLSDCYSLTSVSLPDGLTQLGDFVFNECSSLTSVSLPDGLKKLGDWVFEGCSSLTSMALPDGVTQLGDGVFYDCSSLTSVSLPDGLTQLDNSVFYGCSSLTSMALPDGVTQLGGWVFNGCSSLTSVSLPDGLTRLGIYVFDGCTYLTSAATSAGFSDVISYLRDRYKCITLRKLFLRLLGKYNQAVNEAIGTEAEKNATALANFPTDNSSSLDVGLFLQTMNASGGDGVKGLVGYILKFV